MKRIILSVVLVAMMLGWMLLIFSMSAEPAELSTETSGNTIRKVFNFIYPGFKDKSEIEKQEIIDACQHFVRKLAHFSIYTVLGILLSVNAVYHFKEKWFRILLPVSLGILYAVSDEIHQLYVPGRSGQISDVLLDSAGVLLGCILIFFISTVHKRKRLFNSLFRQSKKTVDRVK